MKKLTACILALLLLLPLASCSKKDDSAVDTAKDTESSTALGTESAETAKGSEEISETEDEQSTAALTDAPATSASTTNPPVTNPPTTNPPATEPPATVPPATSKKQETAPPEKICDHSDTEIRNKKDATASAEGYTGDTYCKGCGKLISSGSSIPKIKQTVSVSHDYKDAEMKIFNEINAERAKAGVAPLRWNEALYAGCKIRAKEHYEFIDLGIGAGPHKRKNGDDFYTAVTETSDYDFGSFDVWGENCGGNSNIDGFVDGWLDSPAHKANMLDSEYSQMAVAIFFAEKTYHAACIFVG